MIPFGTHVRGFKTGRSRRIFQGEKILSTPSFGRDVKPFVPCRIFAACKRTRKCMCGSRSFRSKLPAISRRSSSSFHCWRHLAVQVGTTKTRVCTISLRLQCIWVTSRRDLTTVQYMIMTHNYYTKGLAKSVIIMMKIKAIRLTLRLAGVVKNIFVERYRNSCWFTGEVCLWTTGRYC